MTVKFVGFSKIRACEGVIVAQTRGALAECGTNGMAAGGRALPKARTAGAKVTAGAAKEART